MIFVVHRRSISSQQLPMRYDGRLSSELLSL